MFRTASRHLSQNSSAMHRVIWRCMFNFLIELGTETFHTNPQVLNMFPSTLQTDICLHIHDELFSENPAFRAAVPSCKRSLATKLRVQHFLPRQYVIKQGDEVDKVFFILKGIVHVVADGQTVLALGKEHF